MILKEDVFLWFKQLDPINRLSLMHGLLNICVPIELRFLGNCLEDLCKKDFLVLRDREIKANITGEVQKLSDLNDDGIRSQLILSVALLQGSNRSCASTIFNTLIGWSTGLNVLLMGDDRERTSRLVTEILLLMNMVVMHPAFTFEQKKTLEDQIKIVNDQNNMRLNSTLVTAVETDYVNQPIFYQTPTEASIAHCNCSGVLNVDPVQNVTPTVSNSSTVPFSPATTCCSATTVENASLPKGNSCSTKSNAVSNDSPKAQIKALELKNGQRRRKTPKRVEYRIQVTWSNGDITEISKSHQELCNFHQQLISLHDEPGHKERYIPYFTGPKPIIGGKPDDCDEGMGKMADYLKQLMVEVPHHMLESDLVTTFFRGQSSTISTTSKSENDSVENVEQRGYQNPTNAFSSSSSSLSSTSSASLPASPPPASKPAVVPVNTNNTFENSLDNADTKMKSLTIYNSHQNSLDESSVNLAPVVNNIRSHASPPLDALSKSNNDDKMMEHIFYRDRMGKDLERLRKKFDRKELLNLTEEDLLKQGFDQEKAKQICSRLEMIKSPYQNGIIYYPVESSPFSPIATSCDISALSPGALPAQCNSIYMPDAPLDYIVNYAMTPIGAVYMDIDRTGMHTPSEMPTPTSPSERFMCNGAIERVESPHVVGGNSQISVPPKGFEVGSINRQPSMNGGRPVGGNPRLQNKSRPGNRRDSLTSSSKIGNNQETNKVFSATGEVNEAAGANLTNSVSNDCEATTSVTYSLSQQNHQQQVIGSHQQQQTPHHHMAGNMAMGVQRMNTRPNSLPVALCSCSRAPPHMPPLNYAFMPLISTGNVYAGYSPGNQTPYLATHSTNGFVSATHPSVQPPNYYTSLQSPDCISTDMTMASRFPMQQSGGNVVTQPPPGLIPRTTIHHSSMPPPPSPVPGFLTGPTPNVGFHGNQLSVLPSTTQISLCGGMNPPINPYVITNSNVRLKNTCYNCGNCGHQGSECNETTMDDANRGSHFQLGYHPEDSNVDGCE